jgi:hypothetical protein
MPCHHRFANDGMGRRTILRFSITDLGNTQVKACILKRSGRTTI